MLPLLPSLGCWCWSCQQVLGTCGWWWLQAPGTVQTPPGSLQRQGLSQLRGAGELGAARGVNAASLARGQHSPPRDLLGELLPSISRRHFAPARLSHRGWAPSCPAQRRRVSLLREREVFEGGLSPVSSNGLSGCPGSTHSSPWCLEIVARRNCLTFPRPCVLCCLDFLVLLLIGLMEERFEEKT